MKHLRMYMEGDSFSAENAHPQNIMKKYGITYTHCTPQSMGNQWWFWNCENIPDNLPDFFTDLDVDPMDCVGFGLSFKEAQEIIHKKNN